MLRAQHRAGHGITVTSPIFKKSFTTAGILYVDNTNLRTAINVEDDLEETAYKTKEGVFFWDNSLIATRGALNPDKCK